MSQTTIHKALDVAKNATQEERQRVLEKVTRALGWTYMGRQRFTLYENAQEGIGVKPPRWNYPIVCKDDGTYAYDTFNGNWGNESDFTEFTGRIAQEHAAEKLYAEAQALGNRVASDTLLPDGSRRLEIQVGAGSALDAGGFSGGLGSGELS